MTINEFIDAINILDVKLTQKQLEQLEQYFNMLIEYNKVINLTGIVEKEDVYLKHFYDSITIIKVIDLNKNLLLCDIGTGAGFPGLVLKIVFPNLKVTLLDSLNKRIDFLRNVIDKLKLEDIEIIHTRAEDYARVNRNKFDITTARAVSHLSNLLEFAIPMTKENGYFIALKGIVDEELKESENAQKELNVKIEKKEEFELPNEHSHRSIILFKKNKDNKKYPRQYNQIKNKRL